MGTNWRWLGVFVCGVVAVLLPTHTAWAGMTVYMLSDVVKARFEVISFFLMTMLLVAWGFKACWNVMARDFPKWPKISYRVACGAMMVMAVLMGFILTLISGARELMTPGAWERVGNGYRLSEAKIEERAPQMRMEVARRRGMETLRDVLWSYADGGDGRLPPALHKLSVDEGLWRAPDLKKTPYVYLAPREVEPGTFAWDHVSAQRANEVLPKGDSRRYVVAYEPLVFGENRYVLLSTGEIVNMRTEELTVLMREYTDGPTATQQGRAK